MKLTNNKFFRFIPAFIWMMVIFYFSSRSTTGIGTTALSRFLILKSFHLTEYATLAILLFFASKKYRHAMIIAYLYSLSDELHQYFVPGRNCRFTDTLIDLTGIIVGLLLLRLVMATPLVKKYLLTLKNKLN